MIWISILNLTITVIILILIYKADEFKYKNIMMALFTLNFNHDNNPNSIKILNNNHFPTNPFF